MLMRELYRGFREKARNNLYSLLSYQENDDACILEKKNVRKVLPKKAELSGVRNSWEM